MIIYDRCNIQGDVIIFSLVRQIVFTGRARVNSQARTVFVRSNICVLFQRARLYTRSHCGAA